MREDDRVLTLDQYVMLYPEHEHIKAFEKAYRKRMPDDPEQFLPTHTLDQWECEYDLFVDVGGDADEPIGEPRG